MRARRQDRPHLIADEIRVGLVALHEDEARHARSLRLQRGDAVALINGRGDYGIGVIDEPPANATSGKARRKADGVWVRIEEVGHAAPLTRRLDLIVAAPKGDRLAWMIEKLTELGATCVTLTEFERSVVHASAAHIERGRRTVIEAMKQCGRLWETELRVASTLSEAIQRVATPTIARGDTQIVAPNRECALLYAHPDPTAPSLARHFASPSTAPSNVAVVIGPEGGLADQECQMLDDAGARRVSLGENILRIETAAIAVAACWSSFG